MQKTYLFVAAVGACAGDPTNPRLKSETWGTRICGGMDGRAILMAAVRA